MKVQGEQEMCLYPASLFPFLPSPAPSLVVAHRPRFFFGASPMGSFPHLEIRIGIFEFVLCVGHCVLTL